MTSVCWAPYAETLSRRDVYAVDIMGDAGRSEPVAWISCAADFAVWLRIGRSATPSDVDPQVTGSLDQSRII
jgi:hypothetical protein